MRILCALAVLGLASPCGYTTPAPYDYSNERLLRETASECAELRRMHSTLGYRSPDEYERINSAA